MSYRGPQPDRQRLQSTEIFRHAGNTATWLQFVSASGAGNIVVGFGSANFYRESVITGVFGNNVPPGLLERQRSIGMIAAGDVQCVTQQQLGREDLLSWRGIEYRVDSDPVPARLPGLWVSVLKRADE